MGNKQRFIISTGIAALTATAGLLAKNLHDQRPATIAKRAVRGAGVAGADMDATVPPADNHLHRYKPPVRPVASIAAYNPEDERTAYNFFGAIPGAAKALLAPQNHWYLDVSPRQTKHV